MNFNAAATEERTFVEHLIECKQEPSDVLDDSKEFVGSGTGATSIPMKPSPKDASNEEDTGESSRSTQELVGETDEAYSFLGYMKYEADEEREEPTPKMRQRDDNCQWCQRDFRTLPLGEKKQFVVHLLKEHRCNQLRGYGGWWVCAQCYVSKPRWKFFEANNENPTMSRFSAKCFDCQGTAPGHIHTVLRLMKEFESRKAATREAGEHPIFYIVKPDGFVFR